MSFLDSDQSSSIHGFERELTQALFDHAHEGIILMNNHGEIIAANPKAHQLFDYPYQQMLPIQLTHLVEDQWDWGDKLVPNLLLQSQGVSLPVIGAVERQDGPFSHPELLYRRVSILTADQEVLDLNPYKGTF